MAKEKRRYSLRNRMIGYNLTLMISVVVLCGIIFIASVGLILGSYVQSDINFLLTATADSMESGISYCSDVVTKVRKSELLMDYLVELKDETLSEEEKEELKKEFEKQIFEGCMPVEVMASRGRDTLRFGTLKPVGLLGEDGKRPYAVLQLRKENEAGTAYNLVGFQTNLKFPEQKRVFSMIPALHSAEFLRYGVMHRNTYIQSPDVLNRDFSFKNNRKLFFAGQITGVEGYVESAASGLLAAIHITDEILGREKHAFDNRTVCGALETHISTKTKDFQPMNANFGILDPMPTRIRDKKERYRALAQRALEAIKR